MSDTPTPRTAKVSAWSNLRVMVCWLRAHQPVALGALATGASLLAAWISSRDEFSLIANYLWLGTLPLMPLAALAHDRVRLADLRLSFAAIRRRERALELALVLFITLVAFALRAYELEHYPPSVHGDEGEMGLLALRVIENDSPLALFGTYWLDHPTLFHYVQAIALLIVGQSVTGLRALSVIVGTACVPLAYGIARIGWGRLAGLSAAWLLTISHLPIHWSRIALNNIESVFGMMLFVLLLALVYEQARRQWRANTVLVTEPLQGPSVPLSRPLLLMAMAGLVMGLSQYMYYGSRLIPVVAVPLLFYLWRAKCVSLKQIGALALAALIAFAPLGVFYFNHQMAFCSLQSAICSTAASTF